MTARLIWTAAFAGASFLILAAPVAAARYRSPNAIVLSPGGGIAYVVNQGSGSVSIIDVRKRKVIGEFPVGRHPSHAVVSPNGRRLYVSSRWSGTVEVVDLKKRRVIRSLPAGLEPYGLALSRDGERLYVVDSIGDSVVVLDLKTGKRLSEIPVGREPRYAVLTPDGKRLLVADGLSRTVSIIDPAKGEVVERRELGRASILREIVVSGDGRWAFVSHIISHDEQVTSQMERGWIHSNGFTVMDLEKPGHRVTLLLDRLLDGAANPWGMALSPDGRRLYVSLSGVHEIAIVDVKRTLELIKGADAKKVEDLERDVETMVDGLKIARRVPSGGFGPRALAFSPKTGELLAANYFSDSISVLDPETGALLATIELGLPGRETIERRGERLFNDANLCFQRWFSCASCHQEDATVDGLNWDLSNDGIGNPKNAKSLRDIHDTPPAMWTGVRKSLHACTAAGQRFLGFLPEKMNHEALLAYLRTARREPNPWRRETSPETLARGKKVFARAHCASCHPGPKFTDQRKHDLGFAAKTDLRSRFDTPSLRESYRSAPYLHDGRAKSLRELFTKHNPNGLHGQTAGLTPEELDDLLAYLRTL